MADDGKNPFLSFGYFLFLLSRLYGAAMKLRQAFYKGNILKSEKLPCKVISVGNLSTGGTGKTPMTIYLAELLKRLGYKVAIVSRGYKGSAEKTGGIVCDGTNLLMDSEEAGDEPLMLASYLNVPVVVGGNRFVAGMKAVEAFAPDIILLDDAFQHLRLKRDIDLLLLDGCRPFGNSHLLPRGPLREPVSALSRADAFILTRCEDKKSCPSQRLHSFHSPAHSPVFRTSHVPYISRIVSGKNAENANPEKYALGTLRGRKVFAFSGIAKNEDFQRSLEHMGCEIAGFAGFPDHYRYSDAELRDILQSAKKMNADFLVTTEKDYVRIARGISWSPDLVVMSIKISFGEDAEAFMEFLSSLL